MQYYTRLASKYETQFNGFKVPKGAIYGRNKEQRFVCVDYLGIKSGKLKMFVQNGSTWTKQLVSKDDWRYKNVINILREIGYIPIVEQFRNPYKKIPGKPYDRKTNYSYLPTGSGVAQLVRMRHDNADHSGGGSVISNGDSYRAINKDMERRCVKNPLCEK